MTLMRRFAAAGFCLAVMSLAPAVAQDCSRTLRLDYIFSGTADTQEIALSEMRCCGPWAGRRVNMDKVLLRGNGQISLRDTQTGRVLYRNSFSTLFQEWQRTEEATHVRRSFENVFLVPMPEREAEVTVELYGVRGDTVAALTHPVDPSDILIRPAAGDSIPYRYIIRSGSPEDKIDIAVVAEGYTRDEADLFYEDAREAVRSIFSHEPFKSLRDRFNVVAVAVPSRESGVSVPHERLWRDTALGAHFDTFYSERYLTTLHLSALHDALSGVPYEHIIVLANTSTYGGGGIFNSYVLSAAHNKWSSAVVAHEFGHSFAGLADEYYYDDQYSQYYLAGVEPWEPNITTMADFASKWEDMMGESGVGLHEGGGYMSKGVWRAAKDCRMKTNTNPVFCPVCQRAIRRLVEFYTAF